jgi:serine/threonine-protein kinase
VTGSGFDEELRRLLRTRLILVHLLALGFYFLLAVLMNAIPRGEGNSPINADRGITWPLALVLAEGVIGVLVLWRMSGMSLRSLRLWELTIFASHAAINWYVRFRQLAGIEEAPPNELRLTFAFDGLSSMQPFITLILAYGVLIPNSRRRSLLVVAALTTVPLSVIPAAAAVKPILRG